MANRVSRWLVCAGLTALLSGCVERRFVIESTPPGAKVYVNNRPVGFTPVDYPFTYYGTYLITMELDGHQTRHIEQRIAPPWYAYPPIDFAAENLNPWKVSDVRRLSFEMTPMSRPNLDELRLDAEELRQKGKNLPEPSKPSVPKVRPEPAPAAVGNPAVNQLPPPLEPVP